MQTQFSHETVRSVNPVANSPVLSGIVLLASPIMQATARVIAADRVRGHQHCRKPDEDMGAAGNLAADFWGVLSEITLIDALFRARLKPTGFVVVGSSAPTGPDFVLNGISYNVKAIPSNKSYLCINEAKRVSPQHHCDFYLPIRWINEGRGNVLRPVPTDDVARWELRQGHSPYRSVSVSELSPLASWSELIRR